MRCGYFQFIDLLYFHIETGPSIGYLCGTNYASWKIMTQLLWRAFVPVFFSLSNKLNLIFFHFRLSADKLELKQLFFRTALFYSHAHALKEYINKMRWSSCCGSAESKNRINNIFFLRRLLIKLNFCICLFCILKRVFYISLQRNLKIRRAMKKTQSQTN